MESLYKYRLHELFIARYGINRSEGKRKFGKLFKCSLKMVENHCSRTTDALPIGRDRLKQYAEFFGVSIEDLKTQKAAA